MPSLDAVSGASCITFVYHSSRSGGGSLGAARVRKAEAAITGCALGERCREDWNLDVVVVVHLCGLLAWMGSKDPAGVLDEASLERDRPGQKERVECWTIESLPDEVSSGNDEQRWAVIGGDQPLRRRGALLGAHPTLENHWVQPLSSERCCEVVHVAGALGQDQAVSSAPQGVDHIGEDLLVARPVLCECRVDARDRARNGEVDRFRQLKCCGVDDEYGAWPLGVGTFERVGVGVREGVADRAELEADQVIE